MINGILYSIGIFVVYIFIPVHFMGTFLYIKRSISVANVFLPKFRMMLFFVVFFKWVFPKIMVPQNGWFIRANPIKMDDLGVPLFFGNTQMETIPLIFFLLGDDDAEMKSVSIRQLRSAVFIKTTTSWQKMNRNVAPQHLPIRENVISHAPLPRIPRCCFF